MLSLENVPTKRRRSLATQMRKQYCPEANMAAGTKARELSLESSILWMQQEHATTLKGLHAEIFELQKRCSELTFQLAMETTSTSQEDFYREKSEQLESQLEGEQKKRQDAEHHAQKRGEKLNSLDLQLKAQEKKYKDELKTMAQTVNNLKHELESKGNTIAYLTSQVHLLRKAAQAVGEDTRLPSSSLEDRDSVKYSPVPPKDGAPRHRRLLSNTSRTSSDHGLLTTFVRHRAASGRKMADSEFELDENVPDPTPFLRSQSQAGDSQIRRTERKPLPPIGLGSIDGTTGQGIVQPPPPQQTHSYAFVHKHRHRGQRGQSSSPEVEVESLAVDQADELRRAQEFKSTSTDCN